MRRVIGSVLATLLAFAVVTAAWADCTGETSTHAQMTCCESEHHQCGKTGDPDDCCKHMQNTGPSVLLATTAVPRVKVPVVHGAITLLPAPGTNVTATVTPPVTLDFTRPHDPPHLHQFSLLI